MDALPYAQVLDVPASWETYLAVVRMLGENPPEGLLLHAAGRTDEGFRTIEVWRSRRAWEGVSSERLDAVLAGHRERGGATPTLRELEIEHIVRQ